MDSTDKAFLRDVCGHPGWSMHAISETLGVPAPTLYAAAKQMGLQLNSSIQTTKHDWRLIWDMHGQGRRPSTIARSINASPATVSYAIKRMEGMTTKQRRDCWERYRRAMQSTSYPES